MTDDYQGIDGLTDEEIDREVNYQLGFAQRRVEILTRKLTAMQAHTEAVEKERDRLRLQCPSLALAARISNESLICAFAYTTQLKETLATAEARADRAEHFVRIIAGLRPGHIGESEAGQLVRTAQATLQPIAKAGEP